ncbi:MAG: putative 2-dehydropantoate 2-reductase [Planctomycetota bacterium]
MTDKTNLSFAILGTGALGGLYGGLLANAGNEVHFLARSDLENLQKNGLRVDSPIRSFHLSEPSVHGRPDSVPQVDVAIVAWKTTSNAALAETLGKVLKPNGLVLVLQNGLNVEADSAAIVGEERVLGGCCFLCSNKVGPGHIHHLDYGSIVFGEYALALTGKISNRMRQITEIFSSAGMDIKPSENLALVRWKKLVWNIPFNGLSVVLGASTDKIMRDKSTRQLAEDLMWDVVAAAKACDVEIEEVHVERMLDATENMVPYDSSMFLDYKAKRPIEVESIFGNPVRAALAANYRPTKIEVLYQQLCYLDQENRRAG